MICDAGMMLMHKSVYRVIIFAQTNKTGLLGLLGTSGFLDTMSGLAAQIELRAMFGSGGFLLF